MEGFRAGCEGFRASCNGLRASWVSEPDVRAPESAGWALVLAEKALESAGRVSEPAK